MKKNVKKSSELKEVLAAIGILVVMFVTTFVLYKTIDFVIDVKNLVDLNVKSKLVLLKENVEYLENRKEHQDNMNDFLLQDSENLTKRVKKLEGKK